MSPLTGILVFSAVEIVTLAAWLALVLAGHVLVGTIVLLGIIPEHILAYNVGAGRKLFSIPD